MQKTVKDLLTIHFLKYNFEERIKLVPKPKVWNSVGVSLIFNRLPWSPTPKCYPPGKRQIDLQKLLRKVDAQKSPGGTPIRNKENMETETTDSSNEPGLQEKVSAGSPTLQAALMNKTGANSA